MNRHQLSPLALSIAVPLAMVFAGCTTTKTTIVTTGTRKVGWTLSRSASSRVPPSLAATVHRAGDRTVVQVASERACVEEYLVRKDRQQVEERRVSTYSAVTAIVFEAIGAYLIAVNATGGKRTFSTDLGKTLGIMHIATGGLIYGIPALQQRTKRTKLPSVMERRGLRSVPCASPVAQPVRVEVKYVGGATWGVSDSVGLAPVVIPPGAAITAVQVNGVPVPFRTQRHGVQSAKPLPAATPPQPAKSPTPPVP